MKKIYMILASAVILFAAGCSEEGTDPNNGGSGDNGTVEVSRQQKAGLFIMTATWCQWCPLGKQAVSNVLTANSAKTTGIAAHVSSSDLGNAYGDTLLAMFGGGGTPKMAVGNTTVPNYTDPSVTESKLVEGMNAILANDAKVGMQVTKTDGSGGDMTISVHSKWFTAPEDGSYNVSVFFTESGIVNRQKQPNNQYKEDEIHNNVLRKVITPLEGSPYSAGQVVEGATATQSFTTNMAGFPLENMECVVVLWRKYLNQGRPALQFVNASKINLK